LKDDIELIAVVDIEEERAQRRLKEFGAKKYYTSVEDVLKSEVKSRRVQMPFGKSANR